MANYDISSWIGQDKVPDCRTPSVNDNAISGASITAAGKISTLRAALTAANGAYYTSAQLDKMTRNDMIYALRTINEAAGI